MNLDKKIQLYSYLKNFFSAERAEKFDDIIAQRTKHLCIVTEDIYQSHNASAVVRSCDCFGIQELHVIESCKTYEVNNQIALGAEKWVDVISHKHGENNTFKTFDYLRKEGYKIVATTPHTNDVNLEDLPINSKIALVFGTELSGLSDEAISNADIHVKIPMVGFTESLNISVCAGVAMHYLTNKIKKSNIHWHLTEEDKIDILVRWAKNTIKSADSIIEQWMKEN